ncbi:MAG: hypothetical protein V2A79_02360, partial [Planctomycetota bacterium]
MGKGKTRELAGESHRCTARGRAGKDAGECSFHTNIAQFLAQAGQDAGFGDVHGVAGKTEELGDLAGRAVLAGVQVEGLVGQRVDLAADSVEGLLKGDPLPFGLKVGLELL